MISCVCSPRNRNEPWRVSLISQLWEVTALPPAQIHREEHFHRFDSPAPVPFHTCCTLSMLRLKKQKTKTKKNTTTITHTCSCLETLTVSLPPLSPQELLHAAAVKGTGAIVVMVFRHLFFFKLYEQDLAQNCLKKKQSPCKSLTFQNKIHQALASGSLLLSVYME